jgi:hypothetical protein
MARAELTMPIMNSAGHRLDSCPAGTVDERQQHQRAATSLHLDQRQRAEFRCGHAHE